MTDLLNNPVRCLLDAQAGCGEGPIWDWRTKRLWWVDISGQRIHVHDPVSGSNNSMDTPCLVSALALGQEGMLVATARGIARLDGVTGTLIPLHDPEPTMPDNRLNDMAVDQLGRLWAGTMSEGAKAPSGALYRYDAGGAHRVADGLTIANGMDWSSDGQDFYIADSAPRCIWRYRVDDTGALSDGHTLIQFSDDDGRPDGLCLDCDGTLWVAMCGGGAILGLSPDGVVRDRIEIPAPHVTSCTFGGTTLSTLYVTTGTFGLTSEALIDAPLSGGLFAVQMDTPGRAQVLAQWPR